METTTCRELEGPCDQNLSAESWGEMANTMIQHVIKNHLDDSEMTHSYKGISLMHHEKYQGYTLPF